MYEVLKRRLKSAERNHVPVSALKVLLLPDEVKNDQYMSYKSAIVDCAEMLKHTLRPDDTIGRMGLFEFLIILAPELSAEASTYEKSATSIIYRINYEWKSSQKIPLRISSVTSYPGDGVQDLLNRLDG